MKRLKTKTTVNNTGQAAAELDALLPAIAKRLKAKCLILRKRTRTESSHFYPLALSLQPLAFSS
jgi:hypothetical protein